MLLHENEDLFNGLIIQTAAFKNIPQDDVLNVMGQIGHAFEAVGE